jgi:hypothetical protein
MLQTTDSPQFTTETSLELLQLNARNGRLWLKKPSGHMQTDRPSRLKNTTVPVLPSQTECFLDTASPRTLITTFLLLVSVILVHLISAFRAPPLIALHESNFAVNESLVNNSLELDLTVRSLRPGHRFIDISAILVRSHPAPLPIKSTYEFSSNTTFILHSAVRSTEAIAHRAIHLQFFQGALHSTPFSIVRRNITDFDGLDISWHLQGQFTSILNCTITWHFLNGHTLKFIRSARFLLSLPIGFFLVLFCWPIQPELDGFTTPFCIVMGLIGLLGPTTGPHVPGPEATASQGFGFAAYISLFRLFCIIQLEMVRANAPWPRPLLFFGFGLFFGFLAVVDASASLDRAIHPSAPSLLATERLLACSTFAHAAAVLAWIRLAHSRDASKRRVCTFGGFAAADVAASALALFRTGPGVVTEVLKAAVPTMCGALSLFLLRPSDVARYGEIHGPTGDELAVDALSSDGSDEGFVTISDDRKRDRKKTGS